MKFIKIYIPVLFLFVSLFTLAQKATLKGIILDNTNSPIENVSVKVGNDGTISNSNGFYLIKIPANLDVSVEFTHINYKKITATFNLKSGAEFEFNPVMNPEIEQIALVVIKGDQRKRVEGVTSIHLK